MLTDARGWRELQPGGGCDAGLLRNLGESFSIWALLTFWIGLFRRVPCCGSQDV